MKFTLFSVLALAAAPFAPAVLANPTPKSSYHQGWQYASLTVDDRLNDAQGQLLQVACSNGPYGLAVDYPTFGDLDPDLFIAGFPGVHWGSSECGACYQVSWQGTSVYVTAVDSSYQPRISTNAMNALTHWRTTDLGGYIQEVAYRKVAPYKCY